MSLQQTLDALKAKLKAAKEVVGSSPGPLPPTSRSTVASYLLNSKDDIAYALAEIDNEGTAGLELPSDLPAIALQCEELSNDAHELSLQNDPNNNIVIGDKLKTIDYYIDAEDGYRQRAGII